MRIFKLSAIFIIFLGIYFSQETHGVDTKDITLGCEMTQQPRTNQRQFIYIHLYIKNDKYTLARVDQLKLDKKEPWSPWKDLVTTLKTIKTKNTGLFLNHVNINRETLNVHYDGLALYNSTAKTLYKCQLSQNPYQVIKYVKDAKEEERKKNKL